MRIDKGIATALGAIAIGICGAVVTLTGATETPATEGAPLPAACSRIGADATWRDDDGAPCGGTGDAPGTHDDTGAAYACQTVNVYTWRCTLAAPTTPNN